jgi:hypothetical protein
MNFLRRLQTPTAKRWYSKGDVVLEKADESKESTTSSKDSRFRGAVNFGSVGNGAGAATDS